MSYESQVAAMQYLTNKKPHLYKIERIDSGLSEFHERTGLTEYDHDGYPYDIFSWEKRASIDLENKKILTHELKGRNLNVKR